MASADYLIIGGGIAGTTAAETLREESPHSKIAILEDEPHALYSRVAIPKYLKGLIQRDALFLRKIGDYEKKGIAFYPSVRVAKIIPEKREVSMESQEIFSYKKLLIAAGGRPKPLPDVFRYTGQTKVLRMHTLEDADLIKASMESAPEKTALAAGESFIALEFIEIFKLNGFQARAVAKGDVWGEVRFGKTGGAMIEENFKKQGIVIHQKTEPSFFKDGEFLFKNGEKTKVALVGAGIGINRNLEAFAALQTNKGVLTDEFLKTSDGDIYAAGDIAEFFDKIAGRRRTVGNWTGAFLQGRAAALNMLGRQTEFKNVSTYNISSFGLKLTFVGDVEDSDDVFESAKPESFLRALFKENKLKGAVLINRFNDKALLAELIGRGAEKNEFIKTFS